MRGKDGGEAALFPEASERRADAPDLQARDDEGQDQEEKPVSARPGWRVRKTHGQLHSIRRANHLRTGRPARRERARRLLLCLGFPMSSEIPSISAGFSAPSPITAPPDLASIPPGLDLEREIRELKRQKKAVLLAHYYQEEEIQDLADFVGDSLDLSRNAQKSDADIIAF